MSEIRAEAHWPVAVIAGAYQTGVLGVRSLIRRNVRALYFDCDTTMPGFNSAWGHARACPNPDVQPQAWVDFMVGLAREIGHRAVLIASADRFVTAIARHADILRQHFIVSPGAAMHALLAEKQTQYDLAEKHGMSMPRTRYVKTVEEMAAFAREASFPCLFKPTHFREWQKFSSGHPLLGEKVSIAQNAQELLANYESARAITPDVLVQEIIQGEDLNKRVYLSVYNASSERIAHAMFRSLRCDPMNFGPASITEPVVDAETDEICDRWLRSIGYVGICEIEMKRDSRDGKPKLIEANPRLSGGGDAGPHAGVDICWLHYLDMIGKQAPPVGPNGRDFRHVVLRADGRALPAYWGAGLVSWRALFHSYKPPLAFFDLDGHDFRYSLETLYIFTRDLAWRIVRGIARAVMRLFGRKQ